MSARQASFSGFQFKFEPRQSRIRVRKANSVAAPDSAISSPDVQTVVDSSAVDEQ
jgi:hypothetical protein